WPSTIGSSGLNASLARGLMYGIGSAAASGFDFASQSILTGHRNPMDVSRVYGNLIGGVGGALLGSMFGPWGGMIGAGVGGNLMGSALAWSMAPLDAKFGTDKALYGLLNGVGRSTARFSTPGYALRMADIADSIPLNDWRNPEGVTPAMVAKTFTTVSQA